MSKSKSFFVSHKAIPSLGCPSQSLENTFPLFSIILLSGNLPPPFFRIHPTNLFLIKEGHPEKPDALQG